MNYFKLIRIFVLALKLIPILFFPYYFSSSEIGDYGVVFGYIYILIYLASFEFWFKYNRDFTKLKTNLEKEQLLSKQNQKYLFNYLFVIPILILFLSSYSLDIIFYSFVILISYHLAQEISRLLILLEDHLNASLLQLLQALWVLFLPFGFINSVSTLLLYISIFAFLALVASILVLYMKYNIKYTTTFKLTFNYIEYKEMILILLSALLIKFIFFLPRFILEWKNQLDLAGIFTYFQSISMVSEYFLYFFIQAIFIPKLLKNNQDKSLIKSFKNQMIVGVILLFFLISTGMYILVNYIIKDDIYSQYLYIGYMILFAVCILGFSGFYTSISYINHDDKSYKFAILYSFFLAIVIFSISLLIFDYNILTIISIDFLLYSIILFYFRMFYADKYL